MKKTNIKGKLSLPMIAAIQLAVMFYTLSGVAGKFASNHAFLSLPFIALYALEVAILGGYAIVWQQIIKKVDLSIAYANRSMSLLWSTLWSAVIFKETVTIQNLIGICIVIVGVFLVNSAEKDEKA